MSVPFADKARLLARVSNAISNNDRVTFLLGSGLTLGNKQGPNRGIPGVSDIIETVRDAFKASDELTLLDQDLEATNPIERYMKAMQFVLDCRGPGELSRIINNAVLQARLSLSSKAPDEIEEDLNGWHLRPGVEALGRLIALNPRSFAAPVLTTNFDPLIEIAIRRAGANAQSVFLSGDGRFDHFRATAIHSVVHLHGFWTGSDTLHTPSQLTRERPQLKGALRSLLRKSLLIVMGAGWWNDVFSRTLADLVREGNEEMNVLWTFFGDDEALLQSASPGLFEAFAPLAGQRVLFYKGIDVHQFLPVLVEKMQARAPAQHVSNTYSLTKSAQPLSDLPPAVDVWVGRQTELAILADPNYRVAAITGLGGQGKSTLAAKHLDEAMKVGMYDTWDWRDCREEGDQLGTQVLKIIERLSNGTVLVSDLGSQDPKELARILFDVIGSRRALLVFDNVDQYIDLEDSQPIGLLHAIIRACLSQKHSSRILITCRPTVRYPESEFAQIALHGLSPTEAEQLFVKRGVDVVAAITSSMLPRLYELTHGHPLWVNLIAIQVARGKTELRPLIEELEAVDQFDPLTMLRSIWKTLNERERILLRLLAEIVRPETEDNLFNYSKEVIPTYNQFARALRALRSLDLVVARVAPQRPDALELHPLIRTFIKGEFAQKERVQIVGSIFRFLNSLIILFRPTLTENAPFSVLENWTTKAELAMNLGQYAEALASLAEVSDNLMNTGYTEEFVRLVRRLMEAAGWDNSSVIDHTLFDMVINRFARALTELGQYDGADTYLTEYEVRVAGKTSRYVNLCDVRCYCHWFLREYEKAIDWGVKGVALKQQSGVDTRFDSSHSLALAQRDSGAIDSALPVFLRGRKLSDVIDPALFDARLGGHYYGNIGRCLWLKGNTKGALACYRQSAKILLGAARSRINEGFAALWIGEVYEKTGDLKHAVLFWRKSLLVWETLAPSRAIEVRARIAEMKSEEIGDIVSLTAADVESRYKEWVAGGGLP